MSIQSNGIKDLVLAIEERITYSENLLRRSDVVYNAIVNIPPTRYGSKAIQELHDTVNQFSDSVDQVVQRVKDCQPDATAVSIDYHRVRTRIAALKLMRKSITSNVNRLLRLSVKDGVLVDVPPMTVQGLSND